MDRANGKPAIKADVDHTTGGDKIQSIQPITWVDDGKDKE